MNRPEKVVSLSAIQDRKPQHALVSNVDLVVMKNGEDVSVLFGRCLHRGALLADGHMQGDNLICGLHGWDYRWDTGVSEYNNHEVLKKFTAEIRDGDIYVDADEIALWAKSNPQPYDRQAYLGNYVDVHGTGQESNMHYIQQLAKDGLSKTGHHGPVTAMGVKDASLPAWHDLQILTGQLARRPLADDASIETSLVIGPNAKKPLVLKIPIFVSDMSFGALSEEAKIALSRGAHMAGTGICSGEGGMLPEEQQENERYFYELASGRFAWDLALVSNVQAFHFKGGQGAKTGTGGHLPGSKVIGKIAAVRNLKEGTPAISPGRFEDLVTVADFKKVADEVREASGGIPIGFKLSAQHIENDIDFAVEASADYIILDGRGGGTGAAPNIFKNNISVPTMVALARARKHLDAIDRKDITLIITGGLRTESDFIKALALGADGIAIANSAIQAIGCQAMRACNTNNCPVGIATQKPELRSRLVIASSAQRLKNYLEATVEMMKVLARACGHDAFSEFEIDDLTTYKPELSALVGVPYAGVSAEPVMR